MIISRKVRTICMLVVVMLTTSACSRQNAAVTIEGHYTYEHAFNYDMDGNHFDVSETGTMDFYADGTALDSARQVYNVTLSDGDTVTWVYNYISPSRWHIDGDTLFFAGIKEDFRMEVIESENLNEDCVELAQKISDMYSRSIDYEYQFHIDTLTAEKLQWSFTYRDGHSDNWTFFRTKR